MRLALSLLAGGALLAQVGPMTIRDTSGSTQTSRPITVARVFAEGAITGYSQPRINGIAATEWQVDAKTRWGDGSLKHAIISFHATIPASDKIAVDFINNSDPCHLGNQATCNAAAYDNTGLLALRSSGWAATIAVTNGSTQTANARTILAAGYYTYWLRGPICTQVVIEDLNSRSYEMGFSTSSGSPVLGLHPQFILTAYSGYTDGVRVEFVLENTWTDRLIDHTLSLTASTSAGSVYTRSSHTFYYGGRWHRGNEAAQIWDGTAPGSVEINHNLAYLITTKAVPNYDLGVPVGASTVSTLVSSYNATDKGDDYGDSAGLLKGIGAAGGRAEIAWVHQTQLRAVASGSASLDPAMYYIADVAGHIPVHLRDASTTKYVCPTLCTGGNATALVYGHTVNSDSRPTLWASSLTSSLTSATDRITALGTTNPAGWQWDIPHHPSLAYLPYLLSGSYYLREEMLFWTGFMAADGNPGFLDYSRNGNWSIASPRAVSTRGAAWRIRTFTQTAFILPDDDPEKELFTAMMEKTAQFWEGIANLTTTGNYPRTNTGCTGYGGTPSSTSSPSTAPNRDANCFGKFYVDRNRSNPLNQFIASQTTIPTKACKTLDYAINDCSTTSANWLGDVMSPGYFLNSIGWASEVGFGFDKIIEQYAGYFQSMQTGGYTALWTWLGGAYSYFPVANTSSDQYFTTFADMESAMIKSGSTTLSASITSAATSLTVSDYSQLVFKPVWKRTSSTTCAITALSVASGTIRVGFGCAHGLAVGDMILTQNHATSGFNTNNASGSVIATRYVTAIPSSTELEYSYVTTAPADGSYSIGSFSIQTPLQNVYIRIGSEVIQVCQIETDGTLVVGASTGNTVIGTAENCTVQSYRRGSFSTTAAAHFSGDAVSPAYDVWYQASDTTNGYNWIMRGAASYFYQHSASNLWTWIDTNMWVPWRTSFIASENPTWSTLPRQIDQFTITTQSLPTGTSGASYSTTLATVGHSGSVTWSITAGSLPAGLSLNSSTGAITGTPSAAIATKITVRATDSSAAYREADFGLGINASGKTITISPSSIPSGMVGTAYSQTFSATGGTVPYEWTILASSPPPGLSLSSTGILSGTPTTGGSYTFTVRASDSAGNVKDQSYTVEIAWLPLSITTGATLPAGAIGVAYSQTLAATGGSGSYTWTLTGGTLTGGLSLNTSTGVVSGTPNTPANYSFTVQCASTDGQTASRTFTLLVPAPAGFQTIWKGLKSGGVVAQ